MAEDTGVWVKVFPDDGASTAPGWGDFTTNGDETTSNTWGPDAQGRMWKWAEWNAEGDYSVNLTGGLYHVLCVSGGDGGADAGTPWGQPGLVSEGYWEFSTNAATPIKVGDIGGQSTSSLGMPSSVGSYGVQGAADYGNRDTGRGATSYSDPTGYKSFITGDERQYATGGSGDDRPGRGGSGNNGTQRPGCVIIATAAPNAKALNWVHTTYHAEVNDGTVTAVYTQKHYADGKTTPLPTGELVEASYGVGEGWLFVDGELQPPPPPPEPTRDELIAELQARIAELQKETK